MVDRDQDPGPSSGEDGQRPGSDEERQALLLALTTEQFVLQSAAGITVTEATGRATLYMSALSSALIAIGFATSKPGVLVPMLWITLPTIFLLGVFTIVRLVDTGVQNVDELARIARIRAYYLTLTDQAAPFFADRVAGSETDQALGSMSLRTGSRLGLFTAASMIAMVNSVVGGSGVALALRDVMAGSLLWLSVLAGSCAFICLFGAFFRYQSGRYRHR